MINAGVITLNSFVSPTNKIREYARQIVGEDDFHLIYVKASLETCEKRDVKGLYKKARAGIIKGFTGIDSPFDEPDKFKLILDTELESKEDSVNKAVSYIKKHI